MRIVYEEADKMTQRDWAVWMSGVWFGAALSLSVSILGITFGPSFFG